MTRRNIMRFIISFVFGVLIFWGFGGEAYAAATHTCPTGKGYVQNSTSNITASTVFNWSGHYYLSEDVTFTETKTITEYITICLNGHTIKGNGSAPIFDVEGNLTICDCQHDNETCTYNFTVDDEHTWVLAETSDESSEEQSVTGGVITNGGGSTGAIYIHDSGRLNLYNVNIVGNKAKYGAIYDYYGTININNSQIIGNGFYNSVNNTISETGGIYISQHYNESTITDTTISNNVAKNGAGIFSAGGKFSMERVEVSNNQAIKSNFGGGGIYLGSQSNVKLTDCTIKNNSLIPSSDSSGYGAGIYCNPSSLTLGGTIKVSGNTRNSNPNNVYYPYDDKILIDSSLNVENSKIGISVNESILSGSSSRPLYITDSVDSKYMRIFEKDDETLDIIYEDGFFKAIKPYMIRVKGGNAGGCRFTVVGREDDYTNTYNPAMGIVSRTPIKVYVSESTTNQLKSLSYNDGTEDVPITYSYYEDYYNSENNTYGRNKVYSFDMPSANIMITATFIRPNLIQFDKNGGRGTMSSLYTTDTTYDLPKCTFLPKANKEFAGWSLSNNGPIITTRSINLSGNTVLYAIWKDHTHKPVTVNISDHITKTSCTCGYYIIRYN